MKIYEDDMIVIYEDGMIAIYEDDMIVIYEDDKKTCESNLTDGEVCESTAGAEDN